MTSRRSAALLPHASSFASRTVREMEQRLTARARPVCEHSGKPIFDSAAKCRRAIRNHNPSGIKLYVYQCTHCKGWHRTKRPR